jgi:hypothetical protein
MYSSALIRSSVVAEMRVGYFLGKGVGKHSKFSTNAHFGHYRAVGDG